MRARPLLALAVSACLGPQVSDEVVTRGLILPASAVVPSIDDDPAEAAEIAANDGVDGVVPLLSAFSAGAAVRYYDFGPTVDFAAPGYVLIRRVGETIEVLPHPIVIGAIPGDAGYSPFLRHQLVEVTGAYRGEIFPSVASIMGPRANADALDFDYVQSRTPYYLDNNSRPTLGARLGATVGLADDMTLTLGASGMGGTYDPDNKLWFVIGGADLMLRLDIVFIRAEYLIRRTQFSLGDEPARRFRYGPGSDGEYSDYFLKDGFYAEVEVPVDRFDFVGRWDGLRRRGNVAITSALRSESIVLRYTLAGTYRLFGALRLKLSVEFYDFSDFDDEVAVHLGVAGPF